MINLKERVAVITGGSRGNGLGMAKVLGSYGAAIALFNDIKPEKPMSGITMENAVKELRDMGIHSKGYNVDVTEREQVESGVCEVIQDFGKIDILINNAGIARLCKFENMTDELRDLHFNVNIIGAWNCTKAVIENMMKNKYGRIINISSVTGTVVCDSGFTAYATSKAALIGLTKALAVEYANSGITVNAILPGYIYTEMVQKSAEESNPVNPESILNGIASGIPMKRLGTTEELGELAAFLASDAAGYITGTQNIFDGGSTLPETGCMGV